MQSRSVLCGSACLELGVIEGGHVTGATQDAGCATHVSQRRKTSHAGHQLQQVCVCVCVCVFM